VALSNEEQRHVQLTELQIGSMTTNGVNLITDDRADHVLELTKGVMNDYGLSNLR
jgi:hypothetical protein